MRFRRCLYIASGDATVLAVGSGDPTEGTKTTVNILNFIPKLINDTIII